MAKKRYFILGLSLLGILLTSLWLKHVWFEAYIGRYNPTVLAHLPQQQQQLVGRCIQAVEADTPWRVHLMAASSGQLELILAKETTLWVYWLDQTAALSEWEASRIVRIAGQHGLRWQGHQTPPHPTQFYIF